ncbi:MAG: diguanylate cyclase [Gallionellaceae bacterium]|nr:diguanylate cyclase [Gallionellaceae bacterium]
MPKITIFFPKAGEIAHHGVVQASGAASIEDAVALMESNNLSDVIYSIGEVHAIFTVEDLMKYRHQGRNMSASLNELTHRQLIYVNEGDNILNLLPLFDDGRCRYLGVKNAAGVLDGILSYSDVLASVDPAVMMERRTLADVLGKSRVEMIDASTKTQTVLEQLIYVEDAILIAENGKLAGIVTAIDVIKMIRDGVDMSLPIRNYMTQPVRTITQRATIKAAIEHLKENHFKRAIVVDDHNDVIGRITQRELIGITYGRWAELMKLHAHELGELVQVLESKNQKLQQESLTDPLTGAGNRRLLNQAIEAEIGRFYRHEMTAFSVLLLDIDFFKKINDAFGHPVGDEVLKTLSSRTKRLLRTSDVFARWGGEEFAILLPTADLKAASILAERIRAEIADNLISEHQVTVSIGVAEYQRGESQEGLLERVDIALYEAKNSGRNKVVTAD